MYLKSKMLTSSSRLNIYINFQFQLDIQIVGFLNALLRMSNLAQNHTPTNNLTMRQLDLSEMQAICHRLQ